MPTQTNTSDQVTVRDNVPINNPEQDTHSIASISPATVRVTTVRKYNLNINRTLRRKLEACDTVQVDYNVTGGGITGTLDTASFELFRLACTSFYKELPTQEGRCVIDISEDKKRRAVVQQTYKVRRTDETTNYTLNLYPTRNTMLLNGKDIDRFMTDHLPAIHELMCKAVNDEQLVSVANYNHILGTQLKEVLEQREMSRQSDSKQTRQTGTPDSSPSRIAPTARSTSSSVEPSQVMSSQANCSNDTSPNNMCPKCKRVLHSRGALCEAGNHWIHYHCDRLTEQEIKRLHNEPGFIYICKMCREKDDNTMVKRPCSPYIPTATTNEATSLQLPAKVQTSPKAVTPAEAILLEETLDTCHVCQTEIESTGNRCSSCLASCHDECMVNGANGEVCLSCGASQAQLELVNAQTPTPDAEAVQGDQSKLPPARRNSDGVTKEAGDASNKVLGEESHPRNETQSIAYNQGVKAKQKDKRSTTTDVQSVKHRELRQLESKLRKWEEELKLRETLLSDKEVDRKKLEDYLQKTEARNVEYEATIRTLYRKISLLEDNSSSTQPLNHSGESHFISQPSHARVETSMQQTAENPVNYMQNNLNNPNYVLINGIHQQVTNYVLKKVAQQFDQLEKYDTTLKCNTQYQYTAQQHSAPQWPNAMYQQTPQMSSTSQQYQYLPRDMTQQPVFTAQHNVYQQPPVATPTPNLAGKVCQDLGSGIKAQSGELLQDVRPDGPGEVCRGTPNTSRQQRGGSASSYSSKSYPNKHSDNSSGYTARGSPLFYSDTATHQPDGIRRHDRKAEQSFLYRARSRRGRM